MSTILVVIKINKFTSNTNFSPILFPAKPQPSWAAFSLSGVDYISIFLQQNVAQYSPLWVVQNLQ